MKAYVGEKIGWRKTHRDGTPLGPEWKGEVVAVLPGKVEDYALTLRNPGEVVVVKLEKERR